LIEPSRHFAAIRALLTAIPLSGELKKYGNSVEEALYEFKSLHFRGNNGHRYLATNVLFVTVTTMCP
jgi:hypothetical protein